MAIPTIAVMVTDRIAQTDEVLSATSGLSEWEDMKGRAILRATYRVYNTDKAESGMPLIVREYIAGLALLRLIPTAMDWFRDKRRLADSKRELSVTYYDILTSLAEERKRILAEVRDDTPLVERLVATTASGAGDEARIDTDVLHPSLRDRKATYDPYNLRIAGKTRE